MVILLFKILFFYFLFLVFSLLWRFIKVLFSAQAFPGNTHQKAYPSSTEKGTNKGIKEDIEPEYRILNDD